MPLNQTKPGPLVKTLDIINYKNIINGLLPMVIAYLFYFYFLNFFTFYSVLQNKNKNN